MTWKVLLIGLGGIGFKYDLNVPNHIVRSHARAFSLDADFELVAGIDPNKKNRDEFQDIYSVICFGSVAEVCQVIQIDVVVIASPTQYHLENLREVLSCCKPSVIVMEKPASYLKEQAQEMIDLSIDSGVPIFVNLIRRTEPAVNDIKTLIESGEIQLPCKGVVWYSKGLIHNACHFIDLLTLWLGAPTKVELIAPIKKINNWDIETDLQISFGSSSIYFLVKSSEEFNYYNIELLTKNGRLTMGTGNTPVCWQAKSGKNAVLMPAVHEIENELYQYQLNVVKNIGLYLKGKKHLMPTLIEHVDTLNCIYELTET